MWHASTPVKANHLCRRRGWHLYSIYAKLTTIDDDDDDQEEKEEAGDGAGIYGEEK